MTTIYVVATIPPNGAEVELKKSTIETRALHHYIEACASSIDRVVLFEMEWHGVYVTTDVHNIAYAKVMQNDFLALEDRPSRLQPEVTYHDEPDNGIYTGVMALIEAEYPMPTEHECFAVEAAHQFGFECVDDNAVWSMGRAQHFGALLDHVAKHAAQELLVACKAYHAALDNTMAYLMMADPTYRPTKSADWHAIVSGNAAIKKAEAKYGVSP